MLLCDVLRQRVNHRHLDEPRNALASKPKVIANARSSPYETGKNIANPSATRLKRRVQRIGGDTDYGHQEATLCSTVEVHEVLDEGTLYTKWIFVCTKVDLCSRYKRTV